MKANSFMVMALGLTSEEKFKKGWEFIGGKTIETIGETTGGESIIQLRFNVVIAKNNEILTNGPQGSILTLTGPLDDINANLNITGYELYIDNNNQFNFRKIQE
jgi:hypothetical protein